MTRAGLRLAWAAVWPLVIAVCVTVLLIAVRAGTRGPDALATLTLTPDGTRTGSVYLPRGGPYIFGFESDGPASLRVGPHQAQGQGQVIKRWVFEPGIVAIEVRGPVRRLLWHPPGRRGDPEYLSASSVSGQPPQAARFDASVGTGGADGVWALALLGVWVIAALALLRRRWRAASTHTWLAVVGVFLFAAAVRICDLGAAGQTWDEDVNWSAGRNYVSNILAADGTDAAWAWNYEHPPVMKYLAGVGAQLADGYGAARALMALCMALACALLVPIGQRVLGLSVGLAAGLIAALTPHLIAHGQVVGHEAVACMWWALGLWLAVTVWPPGGAPLARGTLIARLCGLGLVIGLAVGSRFVGGLLGVAVSVVVVGMAPRGQRFRIASWAPPLMATVAVVTFVAVWPRMWDAPIDHLTAAWAKLKKPHSVEPFLGAITNQPGPSYFVIYLMATAPVGVLVACLGGLGELAVRARRRSLGAASIDAAALVIAAWILVPLVVMASPVRQDGVRYVLPSLFGLALLAGVGVVAAGRWLGARLGGLRRGIGLVAAAMTGYLVITAWSIAPYYLDYYNEVVGGARGATARRWFETAWWGEGVDRAVDYVNRTAAPGARVHRCIEPNHLAWFRADLWPAMVDQAARADWVVAYQPIAKPCPVPKDMALVFEVHAAGAPLARVYQRQAPGH